MTPNPQGIRAIIAIFDREFKGNRLDKEDENLWPKGIVYQSGETNNLFLAFNRGVSFGLSLSRAGRQARDTADSPLREAEGGSPSPIHERQWTGPGHLEDTGYIEKQERCPTCFMTDEGYKRNLGWADCTDPRHDKDRLRKDTP